MYLYSGILFQSSGVPLSKEKLDLLIKQLDCDNDKEVVFR